MNTVYKLIPVDYLDLPGTESWLEDMAARGLYLEHMGGSFARFSKDESGNVRYRLEPERTTFDKQEEFDTIMAEKGWEYICPVKGSRCCVYLARDLHAPEIHTDPIVQGHVLGKLVRRETRSMIFSTVLLIAALCFFVYSLSHSDLALRLVEEASVYHLLFPLLVPLGIWGMVLSTLRLRELRNIQTELSAGFPFRKEGRTSKTNYPARLFSPIILALLLVSVLFQFYSVARSWEKPIGEVQLPFSMPAITELTGDTVLDPEPVFIQDFLAQYYNRVEYDWYPLSEIYEADLYATSKNGEIDHRFVARRYDLRLPFLAKAVTEQLAEGPAVDASAPGLDFLLISRYPNSTSLYACAGDKVLVLHWSGTDTDLIPFAQQILSSK